MRRIESAVRDGGFGRVAVEGRVPWVYTVGLAERRHPELVIAGIELPPAADLIQRLAERVVAGQRLEAGVTVRHEGESLEVVAVHPARLRAGLCAVRESYDRLHPPTGPVGALQILIPDEYFCSCHRGSQPRLDLPGGTPDSPGTPRSPNRAMRRHARKRRGGRRY